MMTDQLRQFAEDVLPTMFPNLNLEESTGERMNPGDFLVEGGVVDSCLMLQLEKEQLPIIKRYLEKIENAFSSYVNGGETHIDEENSQIIFQIHRQR